MIISSLGVWLLYITLSERNMIEVAQDFIEDKPHQNCTDQINQSLITVDGNYSQFSTFSYIVIGLGVLIVTFAFAIARLEDLRSKMRIVEDFQFLLPTIIVFKAFLVVQVVAIICIVKDRGEVFKVYNTMEKCKVKDWVDDRDDPVLWWPPACDGHRAGSYVLGIWIVCDCKFYNSHAHHHSYCEHEQKQKNIEYQLLSLEHQSPIANLKHVVGNWII